MSYTPKTWVTRETITTAAMNNIEQGIAGAYSGATTEAAGQIQLATTAQVMAGEGTNTAVTPADNVAMVESKITTHNTDTTAHSDQFSTVTTNITTLQTDLGDLGDQVLTIQGTVNQLNATAVLFQSLTNEEYEDLPAKNQQTIYLVDEVKVYLGSILLADNTPTPSE